MRRRQRQLECPYVLPRSERPGFPAQKQPRLEAFAECTHPVLRNQKSPTPSGAFISFVATLESSEDAITGKMRRASITSVQHTTVSERWLSSVRSSIADELRSIGTLRRNYGRSGRKCGGIMLSSIHIRLSRECLRSQEIRRPR
jgi:hypothetical protein